MLTFVHRGARACIALLFTAAVTSCGGDSSSPDPDFTISVGAVPSTTLGMQVALVVTLTSTGFGGPVTLSVSGVPASWSVDIAGGNTANVISNLTTTKTVTLTIPSNAAPAPTGQQITVQAVGASGTHSASRSVTVANEFIVVMPNGTGGGVHWGAVVGTTVQLKVGTAFRFRNDDVTVHQIHFDGDIPGFVHQPDPGSSQGQSYVVTSTGAGTEDDVHCHIHGTGVGTFTVVVSN
jgi:plastocyanin